MKRVTWLTDVHLNFLEKAEAEAFYQTVAGEQPDAVVLSGDIGEAPDLAIHLSNMVSCLNCPLYFVLGNHDFYRGSIGGVRAKVEALCAVCPQLHWLPRDGVVQLTEETGLVGHDGWGDGRLGNYWSLAIRLNDWRLIEDFAGLDHKKLYAKLNALGDEAAAHLRAVLPAALQRFPQVIVVTHVPPFREASWHEGGTSNDDWLPHFSCKAVGDVLLEAMTTHADRTMTVLCGHTHGAGDVQILPNLKVLTGGAVYGHPHIQSTLEVA